MSADIQARSWTDIKEFYDDLIQRGWSMKPMLQLVQQIQESELSKRLFANTSLTTLIISIYNPIQIDKEALHIEYDSTTDAFHFIYQSQPY